MSEFDKQSFREGLDALGENSTNRFAAIKEAAYAPKATPLPWWHWRSVPMRAAALCCCVALVVGGTLLWWPDRTAEDIATTPNGNFSPLTDEIADKQESQEENKGSSSLQNSANGSGDDSLFDSVVSGSTTASSHSGSNPTSNEEADALLPNENGQALEGEGNWTLTTTTTTLPTAPQQWSVSALSATANGFVRWQETARLGAIAAAIPRTANTLGAFGTRLAKRVCVTLENGTARAAGLTVILNDADGLPICQTVTAENGSAVLIYGGKTPNSLEIKQGSTTLEKLPFSGTSGTVSLSITLPEITAPAALDVMIMAETAPQTNSTITTLSANLSKIVTAAAGKNLSVQSAAVCYSQSVTAAPFTKGTADTAAFLRNIAPPSSATETPSFAAALTKAIVSSAWRENATKVLVIAPHQIPVLSAKDAASVNAALETAAAQGVRVVTLWESGNDTDTELILRAMSFGTGGEFVFRPAKSANGTLQAKSLDTVFSAVLTDLLKKN